MKLWMTSSLTPTLGGRGEEEKRGKKEKENMKVSTESYKIISVTLEDGETLLTLSSDDKLSGIEWY